MGLFAKKPLNNSLEKPLYTLSGHKTWLLVGLGNPGKEYKGTRHNIGFTVLEKFVDSQDESNTWINKKDLKSLISTFMVGDTKIFAIKPTTFMNESGQAVRAMQHFYKITDTQTIVIHDELDLEFGKIRTATGGGSAGHNGLKSIISHSSPDFGRIRIGINNKVRTEHDEKDFVLKDFNKEEKNHLPALQKEIHSILTETIYQAKLNTETRNYIF